VFYALLSCGFGLFVVAFELFSALQAAFLHSSKKRKLLVHVPNHLITCLKSESPICQCHTVTKMRLKDNWNLIFPDLNICKVQYTYLHLHWNHETYNLSLSLSYTSKSDELNESLPSLAAILFDIVCGLGSFASPEMADFSLAH
jgi:hypothetical protein